MSALEIVVVISGLFLGYWVVSKFLLGGPPAKASSADRSPDRDSDTTERHKAPSPSWDEILNVSPHASVDEIRRAYKTLISQYHPDKVAALGDELRNLAEHKSKEITQAYRQALRIRGADA